MLIAKRAFWMRIEIINGENIVSISPTPERPSGWDGETDNVRVENLRAGDKIVSGSNDADDDATDSVLLNLFPDAFMK